MIHFLLLEQSGHTDADDWDPDLEPHLFADGIGHNLLELHRRLVQRGRTTTSGSTIPAGATLVVLMPQQLGQLSRPDRLLLGWRLRRYRVLSIRSDFPTWLPDLIRVDAEVLPNRAMKRRGRRGSVHVLPPLIQRGLIPRSPERGDRLAVVGVKSNPGNVPPQLLDPHLADAIRSLGMTLVIDSPSINDGTDQCWHDFGDVDVVICARRDGQATIQKPPTKLLNAWAAGVIPLARREPAYVEIAHDGQDVIFFDRFEEIPDILHQLQVDDELRNRLRRGVTAAAARLPAIDESVDRWWDLLVSLERPPSTWRACRSTWFMLVHSAPRLGAQAVRRRLRASRRQRSSDGLSSVS